MFKFDFFSVPQIVFGCGQFARIGQLAAPLGRAAFIVYNGGEALWPELASLLDAAGVRSEKFRQRGEPTVNDVDSATELALAGKCDLVIGLGGGSAIDAAKAVAALLGNGGSALDYMEVVGKGQKVTRQAAPWIAIPTTAGTGAEVTRNAVVAAPERKFKASIRGEQLLARIALIDPKLGVSTPPNVTASSGMDALCQCIESYTSTGAQPITDALALQGIRAAARSLKTAYADGGNLTAREDMALAAVLSGITLTNAGLGAVHGFAAPLGANFPIPHGTICAALLGPVIAANVAALGAIAKDHTGLARYATVGRAISDLENLSFTKAVEAAVNYWASITLELCIPRFAEFGMSATDVPAMVELAKKASSMRFNLVTLSDEALSQILLAAL